ncbi:MAG: glycoside hydrolase family 3 N-terminal domain-containing protein [Prolixibacteraceae bacterium]
MRFSILFFFIIYLSGHVYATSELSEFAKRHHVWTDSVLSTMSLKEKIGQLIMVTSVPSQGQKNEKQLLAWIENQHVGGVLFLKTSPQELSSRAKSYQLASKVPLFIAIDGENGLSFRMDSVVEYPVAMGLGAVANDALLEQMGHEVAMQCKALGINLNFAPVADVNSNPNNPIINYRSFGENTQRVAHKAWMLARGMQKEHILVTAKHFPGHGDTGFDSHYTLPVINKSYIELTQEEFVPFRTCIDGGINGIMSAHINLSQIDKGGQPATLSKKMMTDILRDSLGFDGLIFSDGMNMKGITNNYSEADAAVEALKAGVDVIEFILNPEKVIEAVVKAVKRGELSEKTIDEKCRKVLFAKQWIGLNKKLKVDQKKLQEDLNDPRYQLTARYLFEQSLTVLKNDQSLLPLQRLDTLKIASLAIGDSIETVFQSRLQDYAEIDHFYIGLSSSELEIKSVLRQLKGYNLVIAGVFDTKLSKSKNYGISSVHHLVIDQLLHQNKVVLTFFANPYVLSKFEDLDQAAAIGVTYGDHVVSQDAAAQLIFGAIGTVSTLPVTISDEFPEGSGIALKSIGRLKYTIPEETGFNSKHLISTIDSFANFGIRDTLFPGCQILIAKNGKVIFNKSYGYTTYDSINKITAQSIYDWASITKIAGPLPLLMKMTEDSILQLDRAFSNYWPAFKNTDKASITLREILAHQAGFKSWIPFMPGNKKDTSNYRNRMLRYRCSVNYPVRVASNLYVSIDYKREMLDDLANLELSKKKKYFYSDIAFYLFPDLIANYGHQTYETQLYEKFLSRIGAYTARYNPYEYYPVGRIVPTEYDDTMRKELVQGFVHDESAALLGGVSGNAGLFGTANDLAKIMQLYIQFGTYGDLHFIKPSTLAEFTRIQYPGNENRRGLGFDKPYIDNAKKKNGETYPAKAVSANSFGHSGYTGTFVWADPDNELIFVFLSNRVYPSRLNTKLIKLNFRPDLQQAIYQLQNSFHYQRY